MKLDWKRILELSRLREVSTSSGQYAIGFLMAGTVRPMVWLGLIAAVGAGIFAFTYNTLMDYRIGLTTQGKGKALGKLTPEDIRISRILCGLGLLVGAGGASTLMRFSARPGGGAFLFFYMLIGFLYSSPIFRWKEKPGLECISNGLAHTLPFFAGYFQCRTPDLLSLAYGIAFFFFMFGFYLLHCIEDRAADTKAGIQNLCYELGFERTVHMAITATVIAIVFFLMAATQLPLLYVLLPFLILVVVSEAILLQKQTVAIIGTVRWIGRFFGALLFIALLVRVLV